MVRFAILASTVAAALAHPASAAWITITNTTDKTVVIQETRTVNGKVVKGKEYKLSPGEVLKEFQSGPGEKSVLVSEKGSAGNPVKAKLSWDKADAAFEVSNDGTDLKLAPKSK